MCSVRVIKKNGTIVDFDMTKIYEAVKKSADRVMKVLTDKDLTKLSEIVTDKITKDTISVGNLHKIVEVSLDEAGFSEVAKSYRDYRNYKQDYIKMMNAVDKKTRQLRYHEDKSNANTDSSLVSTKRSLIYSELSSEMYKNMFLKPTELDAMNDGYIYIHDRGSRLDTFNCCLADIGSIMKGGFTLGPIEYTEPKTVRSAIAVMSDCMSVLCGSQYGGLSVMVDDILAPYAEKSYYMYLEMYKDMVKNCKGTYNEDEADKWAIHEVENDLAQGLQGMEHTFNSVSSSRGR